MQDCLFCRIVRDEIPCRKILESKDFLAFLDIRPVNQGHALVIPKHHCENILDFPKSEETDFIEFVKKVSKAVIGAVGADAFNLGMNNGVEAGQVVFHAHLHVIPRFKNDGLHAWHHKEMTQAELEDVHKKVLAQITKT